MLSGNMFQILRGEVIRCSQAVSHLITDQDRRCLTSERESVFSASLAGKKRENPDIKKKILSPQGRRQRH